MDKPQWKVNKEEYIKKYVSDTYDRITYQVRKGEKQIISDFASSNGISMNQLIDDAVVAACPPLKKHRKGKPKDPGIK